MTYEPEPQPPDWVARFTVAVIIFFVLYVLGHVVVALSLGRI